MTFRTLIRRSLRFHARSHLGVVLGAAVGSAALIGALVVGDSVKESLRENAENRLGWTVVAIDSRNQLFSRHLADFYRPPQTVGQQWYIKASSALHLAGSLVRGDGTARANLINIYGVDQHFGFENSSLQNIPSNSVVLNVALAKQLNVKSGDEVLLRIQNSLGPAGEMAVSPKNQTGFARRLKVAGIVPAQEMGDFSLYVGQMLTLNAFVRQDEFLGRPEFEGRANLLLLGSVSISRQDQESMDLSTNRSLSRWFQIKSLQLKTKLGLRRHPHSVVGLSPEKTLAFANDQLRSVPRLSYWGFEMKRLAQPPASELRSRDVFLPPAFLKSLRDTPVNSPNPNSVADVPLVTEGDLALRPQIATNHQEILTYLANLLRAGTNATPYSMVTAAGSPWTPSDMQDDEILVNPWLAEDLQVKAGDEIALVYFDPESGAHLRERTNWFRVRGGVAAELPWADRTLMPDFPGIEKAESTSEWDAGFPLVNKIRPKDDDYWKKYRGTPKAFITLAAGQKLWGNRFGNLTAIRFPFPTNPIAAKDYQEALERKILTSLNPEEIGLRFEPVRERALKAAAQSQDFGGLFIGFSFFLILAALLLMAMLFQFGLEQRTSEAGTLLALGYQPKHVRRLLLGEGIALAFIGGVLGTLGGIAYARAMLHGLATIWRDAVGTTALDFHVTSGTIVTGLFASVLVSGVTLWLTLRRLVKRPARELLAGDVQLPVTRRRWLPRITAVVCGIGAISLIATMVLKNNTANAGAFFGAGALLLIAGLSAVSAWLGKVSEVGALRRPHLTLSSLGARGGARRRKRSVATVAMLASGCFLIVAIGVFRLDANQDATSRTSGTGGFALMGETTLPVIQDLNTRSGRDFFALNAEDLTGVNFVPFRVHHGDEASCLNLNGALQPRLLGVKPELLVGRFTFAKLLKDNTGWNALKSETRDPKSEIEIPAIGDANSIQWAMHKQVGDTIDYVDERGQPFKVRIVGAVANSILQGSLIIDEAEFVKRFPGQSGYETFLIDAPSNTVMQVSATLSRALQDVGLELVPAAGRLAQFNAVQNTYLGTFQVLGGLGLLLGSVGLGIVVLRNVLERRGELAVLQAVGYRKPVVQKLLLIEHGALLGLGLAIGLVAAAVAVVPSVLSPGAALPYRSLALTLAAVLANGMVWTWLATRWALRGNLLAALRNE